MPSSISERQQLPDTGGYRKAAAQGDAGAENNLGVAYNYGNGVDKNFSRAVYWYRKAADQGNPSAQTNLGVAYYQG
ncbi:tetratricopeptide repeat protein, partial [Acidithiobacillus sp.]|uniref:tetratricopeptide repeat protein n=1 Tax=Acidithiobacillus sp. TaxID=1872118 RepID=UPI0025874775